MMFWGSYLISKIIWKHFSCDFDFLFFLKLDQQMGVDGEGQFSSSAREAVWLWGCLVWESVSTLIGYRLCGGGSRETQVLWRQHGWSLTPGQGASHSSSCCQEAQFLLSSGAKSCWPWPVCYPRWACPSSVMIKGVDWMTHEAYSSSNILIL